MTPPRKKWFRWRGVSSGGEVVSGNLAARDKGDLELSLAAQGVILVAANCGRPARRLAGRDVTAVLRQLATLLRASLPVGEVFNLLRRQAKPRLRRTLTLVWQDIEAGGGLAQSLAPHLHPRHRFIVHILQAGESSGRLAPLAAELAAQREKHEKIQQKLKRAVVYPATVLAASAAVIGVLLVTVIPQFESFYAGFGGELPDATRLTLRLFSRLSEHGPRAAALLAALGLGALLLHRNAHWFRRATGRLALHLPLAGALRKAYWCRLFATVVGPAYAAGVPLATALEWLSDSSRDAVFREILDGVSARLEEGAGFSDAIRRAVFFDRYFEQVVRIGENSGRLDESFRQIAAYYDEQIAARADRVIQLTEPCLILLIAGIVGWIIATMYLPIFNLGFAL